jgi:hypothetical protein
VDSLLARHGLSGLEELLADHERHKPVSTGDLTTDKVVIQGAGSPLPVSASLGRLLVPGKKTASREYRSGNRNCALYPGICAP